MTISDIPVPEVYKQSADFRFFLRWIDMCFGEVQNKTDNLIDLLDPLRCPTELLWLLADTCGYKYDERASVAFNRLVILYFATLIMYRGSYTGISLAAEMNLAQLNLDDYVKENPALAERLEDTSIPTNSVSIASHPELGFIDIVYFAEKTPTDVCLEYVRPLGMYCFTHAGVVVNARTKVSVDARLTNLNDSGVIPGPAFLAHYRRADYASMQRFLDNDGHIVIEPDSRAELHPEKRHSVYYRNMKYEKEPVGPYIDPGYRSLFSLQLCNNEHIVKALLPSLETPDPIFSMGYGPQDVTVTYPDNYLKHQDMPLYNLRLDRNLEKSFTPSVYTNEKADTVINPKPAVNPVMTGWGQALSLNADNTLYTRYDESTRRMVVDDIDNK